jgi:hypothetical protein
VRDFNLRYTVKVGCVSCASIDAAIFDSALTIPRS